MFVFNVENWVPAFILADKNGYAIAKAIEAAMQALNDVTEAGVSCLIDYDAMPEWRLDELAWEYDLLYDYSQSVDVKRKWIKDAETYYRRYGTKSIMKQYLDAYFDAAEIREWWDYGGDPFHFIVNLSGEYTETNNSWAINAINRTKNVRSVLDYITFNSDSGESVILSGADISGMELVDTVNMIGG